MRTDKFINSIDRFCARSNGNAYFRNEKFTVKSPNGLLYDLIFGGMLLLFSFILYSDLEKGEYFWGSVLMLCIFLGIIIFRTDNICVLDFRSEILEVRRRFFLLYFWPPLKIKFTDISEFKVERRTAEPESGSKNEFYMVKVVCKNDKEKVLIEYEGISSDANELKCLLNKVIISNKPSGMQQ
jgi:hypothetical protein